jgi:hypothetical protein
MEMETNQSLGHFVNQIYGLFHSNWTSSQSDNEFGFSQM